MVITASAQHPTTNKVDYSRIEINLTDQLPVYSGEAFYLASTHGLYGASLGYVHGFRLSKFQHPVFLEVGPELSYASLTDELDYWEDPTLVTNMDRREELLSLSSPINLTYSLPLSEDKILMPTFGLTVKANLLASVRTSPEKKTFDLFDAGAKRLQLGCNAGCGITINRLYLGLRYAFDLTPFLHQGKDDERYQTISLRLGYTL